MKKLCMPYAIHLSIITILSCHTVQTTEPDGTPLLPHQTSPTIPWYDAQTEKAVACFLDTLKETTKHHFRATASCNPPPEDTITQKKIRAAADKVAKVGENTQRLAQKWFNFVRLTTSKGENDVAQYHAYTDIINRINTLAESTTSPIIVAFYNAAGLYFVESVLRIVADNMPAEGKLTTKAFSSIIAKSLIKIPQSLLNSIAYLIVGIAGPSRLYFSTTGALLNSKRPSRLYVKILLLLNKAAVKLIDQ